VPCSSETTGKIGTSAIVNPRKDTDNHVTIQVQFASKQQITADLCMIPIDKWHNQHYMKCDSEGCISSAYHALNNESAKGFM
jgi:hypothetical protein